MPGRIKHVPSGAVAACSDGRVFAGCSPCGEGCPSFSLSPRSTPTQINLLRYFTGIPELDENGDPIEKQWPATGYVQRAFYAHYWGEEQSMPDAASFCKAFGDNNEAGSNKSVRIISSAPFPQLIQASPNPLAIHQVFPTYPDGFFEALATPPFSSIGESPSTANTAIRFSLLQDPEEAYHYLFSGNVHGRTMQFTSDFLVDEAPCPPEAHNVSVKVNKQQATAVPGAIALTATYYDSEDGLEKAVRARYQVREVEQIHPHAIRFHYALDESHPAGPFKARYGSPEFQAVVTYFNGVLFIMSIKWSWGLGVSFITDPSIIKAEEAGFLVGATTGVNTDYSTDFFVANFDFCPDFPPPRIRVAAGSGSSFRGGCHAQNGCFGPGAYFGPCTFTSTFDIAVRVGTSGVTTNYFPIPFSGPWDMQAACASYLTLGHHPANAPFGSPGSVPIYIRLASYIFGVGMFYSSPSIIGAAPLPDIRHPDTIVHVPLAGAAQSSTSEASGGYALSVIEPELLN